MAHDVAADLFLPSGWLRTDLLHDAMIRVAHESLRHARRTAWESIRSPHLFMGLLAAPDAFVRDWGRQLGADLDSWLERFIELFEQPSGKRDALLCLNREFLSDNAIRMLRESYLRTLAQQRRQMTPMDLLITLFKSPYSTVAECFDRLGLARTHLSELAVRAERHGGGD